MSQWTHITGAIRVDGIVMCGGSGRMLEVLKLALGRTCKYGDCKELWDRCNVPRGSEGSLQYYIHEYDTGLPWAVVTIWGDLRDYGSSQDVEKIKNWFETVGMVLPVIRQAILEIKVDGIETRVLRWVDGKVVTYEDD